MKHQYHTPSVDLLKIIEKGVVLNSLEHPNGLIEDITFETRGISYTDWSTEFENEE